jgi:hypothetical protein
MFGTIVSVVSVINSAFDLYRNAGTLVNGDGTERVLDALDRIHEEVVKLNDNVWYAPHLRGLTDTGGTQHALVEPSAAREWLESVHRALGEHRYFRC